MRYLIVVVAMIVSTSMIACGKKNDSVANNWINGCPIGSYNYNGQCIPAPGGGYYYGVNSSRFGGSITGIGTEAMALMLGQYGRFCVNNGWNNWPGQFNYYVGVGSYNCRNYSNAGYVRLYINQAAGRAQIIIGAGTNNGMSPFEVVFNGRIYPINNSAGMEIRGAGQAYSGGWNAVYDQGVVLRIDNGTPASSQMNAVMTYRGQNLGEVQLYRY